MAENKTNAKGDADLAISGITFILKTTRTGDRRGKRAAKLGSIWTVCSRLWSRAGKPSDYVFVIPVAEELD
jgi:hypothetical protein